MARKPRVHVPGGIYHVMLRGNNGHNIFFSDADRYRLSLFMQQATCRYGCLIHAFCFMSNHIHLMVQVKHASLSKIIQNIAFRYARWINFKHDRTGHLFQARFHAILIDKQNYLLQVLRYIHLNPVKAGLVKKATDYRWSGHASYLGLDGFLWLTTDWMLSQFSTTCPRQAYAKFVETESDDDIEELTIQQFTLTPETSSEYTYKCTLTLEEIIAFVYQHYDYQPQISTVQKNPRQMVKIRAIIAWLCVELKVGTMSQVAKHYNCSSSAISKKVHNILDFGDEELISLKKTLGSGLRF